MKIVDDVRRYGAWAGDPAGFREDPKRCIEEVWERGGWPRPHQCNRKRGHGPDGLYCKQHDPVVAERRRRTNNLRNRLCWLIDGTIPSAEARVGKLAVAYFRQQATHDELEAAVNELETVYTERDELRRSLKEIDRRLS